MALNKIKIGMVGFGTVGSGVWAILTRHRKLLQERVGAQLEISRIAVRSKGKRRRFKLPNR
jgi:homoserine dehydrogenase